MDLCFNYGRFTLVLMSEKFALTLYRDVSGQKFDQLEAYAGSLEGYLSNEVKALESRLKKETATLTEERRDEVYEFASDDFFQLAEAFPQTLRISFFVHCFSLFEHSLNELATDMGKWRGVKISPKDLRDDGIMRSKTFLKNVVLVGFPDSQPIWEEITTLNRIRNYFVHREGCLLEGDNIRVEQYVASSKGALQLVEEHASKRIVIASEVFNQSVLKTLETFNESLFKALLADAKD